MKKLIPLILLTSLVGCAEYSSLEECKAKERQKLEGTVSNTDRNTIEKYCLSLTPKACKEDRLKQVELRKSIPITSLSDEYFSTFKNPKSCKGW
tara:strand:+ start:145 stop:426 length:282 start_codon:yes stop_codon:yes gene_type:complete